MFATTRTMSSLGRTLLAFSCFILYFKAKFSCYSRYLLISYFCIPVPYGEKDIFFGVLLLEGLVGLHRPFNFNLFSITSQGIDLDFYDIECFALEMNRGHSVIFEIVFKYCILNSFLLTMRATSFLLRDSCPQ